MSGTDLHRWLSNALEAVDRVKVERDSWRRKHDALFLKQITLLEEMCEVRKELVQANFQLADAIGKTYNTQKEVPHVRH